ncbi:hypothetical protein FSP39_014378 [Pinctada imbricata]|uniref:Uncharacterized protein n=1 Tax=Pinctada imbricata TaxID=66713 RepID=A0AA88Y0K0_PINIB|nr:hypothetical protein FSP39_014378 [Pinctada imbricata]
MNWNDDSESFQISINRTVYTCAARYIKDISQYRSYTTSVPPPATGTNGQRRYNVGVFGAGRIASSVHINNILRDRRFNLKWVVEDNPVQAQIVQNNYFLQDTPFFTSKEREMLLSDKNLDAVFVFTSTPTHADFICSSLNSGKNVMTEKPTGENSTDIKLCYETAEKKGKVLLTGFQRRFDPVFKEMREIAMNGSLGTLQLLKVTTRDNPKPSYEFLKSADRTGCNIISDLAVHDIDMTVWLTMCVRPVSIYTVTHIHDATLQDIGEPDVVTLTIKFENGLIATIDVVREAVYGYDIRTELFGTLGMAQSDNPRRTTAIVDKVDGATMQPLFYSFPQRFEKAFATEISHFYDCLNGDTKPLITKEECLLVQEIVNKGIESYKTGQVVPF